MVKVETIGMLDSAKVNPTIKHNKDVENYSFITYDNELYLVASSLTGDDCGRQDVSFKKGELLNGYLLKAWEGQKLVIDGKHITGGISSLSVGTSKLDVGEDGKLKVNASPTGVHLVVTDVKIRLTEAAIKAKVVVA